MEVDFRRVYGNEFELLNKLKPASVIVVEGSGITVEQVEQ